MAVNYNDGKWHGWNGGECPLHPETVVEVVSIHGSDGGCAKNMEPWGNERGASPVVAFRVIKEHREPRDFWIEVESGVATTRPDHSSFFYTHVREVI